MLRAGGCDILAAGAHARRWDRSGRSLSMGFGAAARHRSRIETESNRALGVDSLSILFNHRSFQNYSLLFFLGGGFKSSCRGRKTLPHPLTWPQEGLGTPDLQWCHCFFCVCVCFLRGVVFLTSTTARVTPSKAEQPILRICPKSIETLRAPFFADEIHWNPVRAKNCPSKPF